ncbi:hypothetical protein V8E53_006329 [Lactarius tabidus]
MPLAVPKPAEPAPGPFFSRNKYAVGGVAWHYPSRYYWCAFASVAGFAMATLEPFCVIVLLHIAMSTPNTWCNFFGDGTPSLVKLMLERIVMAPGPSSDQPVVQTKFDFRRVCWSLRHHKLISAFLLGIATKRAYLTIFAGGVGADPLGNKPEQGTTSLGGIVGNKVVVPGARSPSPALETLVLAIPSKERLPSPWTPLRVGPHPERTVSSSAPVHHLHLACGAGTLPGRRVRIAAPHLVALDATSCPHRKPMAGVKCYYGPMTLKQSEGRGVAGPLSPNSSAPATLFTPFEIVDRVPVRAPKAFQTHFRLVGQEAGQRRLRKSWCGYLMSALQRGKFHEP